MIEKLKEVRSEDGIACGDPMYSLDEIKKVYQEVIEITDYHWLALHPEYPFNDKDPKDLFDCSLAYAFFSFGYSSDADDFKNKWVSLIFRGQGPTSSLKELRHTYWGPKSEGYTFYLPMKATIKALEHLQKYFED